MLLQPCILDLLPDVLNQQKNTRNITHYLLFVSVPDSPHGQTQRISWWPSMCCLDQNVCLCRRLWFSPSARTTTGCGCTKCSTWKKWQSSALFNGGCQQGQANVSHTVLCFISWVSLGTLFISLHVQGGRLCVPAKSPAFSSFLQSVSSILSELWTCSQFLGSGLKDSFGCAFAMTVLWNGCHFFIVLAKPIYSQLKWAWEMYSARKMIDKDGIMHMSFYKARLCQVLQTSMQKAYSKSVSSSGVTSNLSSALFLC